MSEIWAVIVTVIILMVIYGYISSKINDRKVKKKRGESVPIIDESISANKLYTVYLSDGRVFKSASFIGEISSDQGIFALGGYEGMIVLKNENGNRVFIKKHAIRIVEEF